MKNSLPLEDVQFLMKALRQASIKWPGRTEALRNARKRVKEGVTKKGKIIWKFHWQCAHCRRWSREEKSMEVDHVVEIGSFTGCWTEIINRHFPRPVNKCLQVLCITCHMKKTKAFNAAHIKFKRKKEN